MPRIPSIVLLFLLPAALPAQIGYTPANSPYREIRTGTTLEAFGGTIMGSGGSIPAGPRDGPVAGLRVLLRAKNTVSLGFSIWGAKTVRTPINSAAAPSAQLLPAVDQDLFGAEATIQFNLTGGKKWHGIAPFTGVAVGLAKSGLFSDEPDDPFGYEFGSRFFFAPMLGTRLFLSGRSYLRVEARGYTWKIKYPAAWVLEPSDDPGTAEAPNAVNPTGSNGSYTVAPSLQIGFGFDF